MSFPVCLNLIYSWVFFHSTLWLHPNIAPCAAPSYSLKLDFVTLNLWTQLSCVEVQLNHVQTVKDWHRGDILRALLKTCAKLLRSSYWMCTGQIPQQEAHSTANVLEQWGKFLYFLLLLKTFGMKPRDQWETRDQPFSFHIQIWFTR